MVTTNYYFSGSLNNAYLVQISRTKPKNITVDLIIDKLMPDYKILNAYKNNKLSAKDYTKLYKKQLLNSFSETQRKAFAEYMYKLNTKHKIVQLLCWEDSTKFCHRHIALNFLKYCAKTYTSLGTDWIFDEKLGRLKQYVDKCYEETHNTTQE